MMENFISEKEVWKNVVGFDGYYVSNFGNVKSFKRSKEKYLKQKTTVYGYKEVALQNKEHKQISKSVHRLVAETFIPNINNLKEVNHKDKNKTNNFVENLEWISHEDNTRYSIAKKVIQLDNDVIINQFESIEDASKKTGFSRSAISAVCNKRRKISNGYSWEFLIA